MVTSPGSGMPRPRTAMISSNAVDIAPPLVPLSMTGRSRPVYVAGEGLDRGVSLRLRRWQRLAGRRAHALVDEALEAAAVEVLADVDVAVAVDRQRMRHVQ